MSTVARALRVALLAVFATSEASVDAVRNRERVRQAVEVESWLVF